MHSYFLHVAISGNRFILVGKIFGALGRIRVACRIILAHLGRKTAAVRQVEAISEDRGRILAPTWPILDPSWSILAPTWTILTPSWSILAPTWAILEHLGAILEHLGANWEQLGANMAKNLTVFFNTFRTLHHLGEQF